MNEHEEFYYWLLLFYIAFFVFLLFSLPSCTPTFRKTLTRNTMEASHEPAPSPSASSGHYELLPDSTFTAAEKDDEERVQERVNEIVQGPCFKDVLLHKRSRLLRTNGRTREEVIEHLQQSHATVIVTLYYQDNNVIGYRNPGSIVINANRKFFNSASVCDKASNTMHEISHVLGYEHDYHKTKRRAFSVPYSINYAFSECCQ